MMLSTLTAQTASYLPRDARTLAERSATGAAVGRRDPGSLL